MNAAERTAADQFAGCHEWLAVMCHEFSLATGWAVHFDPHQGPGECGSARGPVVQAGRQTVGSVKLVLPSTLDTSTRRTAELSTQILVELLSQAARNWEDSIRRQNELTTLVDLGRAVACAGDRPEMVPSLLDGAVRLLAADWVSLNVLSDERDVLCEKARSLNGSPVELKNGGTRRLATAPNDMSALVDGPLLALGEGSATGQWWPAGIEQAACAAVEGTDGPIGTLWAGSRDSVSWGKAELSMLSAVAGQLGSLLGRLSLQVAQTSHDRLVTELQGLSESHSGDQIGVLPPGSGFQAVGRCCSKYEVGGDLCELLPLDQGRTLVAVGDACGHSVQAAFVMTAVRSAMSVVLDGPDCSRVSSEEVVARINRALCRVTEGHQFMSCLVGVLDANRNVMQYTNAGHPPPLLVRGKDRDALVSHGMPLGISSDAEYGSSELSLRGDDVIVLFSDGVIETMNHDREMFRSEGVIAALGEVDPTESLEHVLARVWDSCEAHDSGETLDDRTLLLLRMETAPVPAAPHATFGNARRDVIRGSHRVATS